MTATMPRSFDTFFEDSRKKFQSEVDRMRTEMEQEMLSRKPVTFSSSKSATDDKAKKTDSKESVTRKEQQKNKPTDIAKEEESKKSMVIAEDGSFKVCLPVTDFKPEELAVKVMGDSLLVEAHHEEKDEKTGGFRKQHFQQQFLIPKSCDKEALTSSLSAAGVLTVSAPSKAIKAAPSEKNIEIQSVKKTVN